jgi:hypothetical protein
MSEPYILYPDRVPPDPKVEAALAEQVREGEVTALLKERSDLLAQREAALRRKPEKGLIVVDARGQPVPGLFIKNISVGLAREEIDESVRKLDESLAIVDRELGARGYDGD